MKPTRSVKVTQLHQNYVFCIKTLTRLVAGYLWTRTFRHYSYIYTFTELFRLAVRFSNSESISSARAAEITYNPVYPSLEFCKPSGIYLFAEFALNSMSK